MAVYNYDVVVLGTGPAGEGAAMNAAKAGRKVAVVDNRPLVGGNCTHLGTIPSKALRHSVRQIMQYNTNPLFRQIGEPRWFSFPDVLKSAERVISKQVASRTGYYARNRTVFSEPPVLPMSTVSRWFVSMVWLSAWSPSKSSSLPDHVPTGRQISISLTRVSMTAIPS